MPVIHKKNLALIAGLGFSSGLPLALTSSTLSAWFTEAGASLLLLGSLGLIGQPYLYKFLWSPLLDRFSLPILGHRRGWILFFQLTLVISIGSMAFLNPQTSAKPLIIIAFLIAFLSASQDTVIDAYRTELFTSPDRGLAIAFATWGYRIAMLITGGVALLLADRIGWRNTYLLMAVSMFIGLIATLVSKNPNLEKNTLPSSLGLISAFKLPWLDFFTRKSALVIILFIILYKLGDAFSVSLTTPFLIRGLGFSLTTIGVVNKLGGFIAALLGALLGGLLLTRWHLYRALFYFGVLQAIAILLLVALSCAGKNYILLVAVIFADNFCNSMGSMGLMAFFMNLCNPQYTASQYALFSAIANAGRIFISPIAGLVAHYLNWPFFFIIAFFICVPGLLLLRYLRREVSLVNNFPAEIKSI